MYPVAVQKFPALALPAMDQGGVQGDAVHHRAVVRLEPLDEAPGPVCANQSYLTPWGRVDHHPTTVLRHVHGLSN